LADIRALLASWFRDGPRSGSPQGVADFVAEIGFAQQQGLHVLVNIVPMDEDYAVPLARNDRGWNARALSRISIARFSVRFRTLLTAINAAGPAVDAVEFGNEDDSFYYDADVPVGHAASLAEIHTWLRGYGEWCCTTRIIIPRRRSSHLGSRMVVIRRTVCPRPPRSLLC
jgi:hypothetical protein